MAVGVAVGVGVGVVVGVVVAVGVGVAVVVAVAVAVGVAVGVVNLTTKKEKQMKKAVVVHEVDGEGLISLLGKNVLFMSANYNYYGKLVGVNDLDVQLEDAGIVYETGEWSQKKWSDYQKLPTKNVYLRTALIESYFEVNKET